MYRLHRAVEILLLRQMDGARDRGEPQGARQISLRPRARHSPPCSTPFADSRGPDAQPLDADSRCFFLARPRIDLYRRIDSRVEGMLAGGLLEETVSMLCMGVAPDANSAARAIGYRQTMEALLTLAGRETLATLQDLVRGLAGGLLPWPRASASPLHLGSFPHRYR